MIHSMTGFGKSDAIVSGQKINVQIRSLNSKHADISLKIPSVLKEKEIDYRKLVSHELKRGKIELYIAIEKEENKPSFVINSSAFHEYMNQLKTLGNGNVNEKEMLSTIVGLPDVLINNEEEISVESHAQINGLIEEAMLELTAFRKSEGQQLAMDLNDRITEIQKNLKKIESVEEERITIIRNRLNEHLKEVESNVDKDRFEQEMIFYMEKFDISEEKVRLRSHCEYFLNCMNNEREQGRKLAFIGQEIGREINTLGSKANHAEMQKIVVQMKDELEKIKEQVLNIL